MAMTTRIQTTQESGNAIRTAIHNEFGAENVSGIRTILEVTDAQNCVLVVQSNIPQKEAVSNFVEGFFAGMRYWASKTK